MLTTGRISVYPNPFSNQLTVTIDGVSNGFYTITSLPGATIHQGVMEGGKADLQLQHLKPGFYILGIEINGKLETVKVIRK